MTDDAFLSAFEEATITRAQWTHEAHVRMAWLYAIREPDLEAVCRKATTYLRRLSAALASDPTKYHETVTIAFATLIYARAIADDPPTDWERFADANPDLFDCDRPILHTHYREETLYSEEARLDYIEPDLLAF